MYLFGLLMGHEPRLVDRRRRDRLDDGKGDATTSTQYADDSAGDTGSLLTAETPIEQVPVVELDRGGGSGGGRRTRRRSRSQAPRRDRLSLWSRLMCQPEVFDPHVEASPMAFLTEVSSSMAASPLAEKRHRTPSSRSRHSTAPATALGGFDDVSIVLSAAASPSVKREEEDTVAAATAASAAMMDDGSLTKDTSSSSSPSSSSSSDTASQEPSSPVSSVEDFSVEVAEVGAEDPLDDAPPALSVSATGDAPAPKPRRAFRVTDTRKCRCHPSRTTTACLTDATSTANTSFATSCAQDSCSSGVGTFSQSGTTTTTATGHSTNAVGRLISPQELAVKRSQRRQQTREAARRLREYNAAWRDLVASQRGRVSGRRAAAALESSNSGSNRTASDETADGASSAKAAAVVAVPLTNEALESHRGRVDAPAYELPSDFLVRMGRLKEMAQTDKVAQDGDSAEDQHSISGDSRTSDDSHGVVVIDDEGVGVEAALPTLYGTMLRCSEAAEKASTSTAAARVAPTSILKKDTASSLSAGGSHAETDSLPRIPRGKYALGSRGYIEHVMFSQRRQQECALFALLTEAHHQARAAYLRLSQVYYYYVLPILAQHQARMEVEGLVNSLLQCGSGSLRVFHADFCKTVAMNYMYDYTRGGYVPADLLLVQPIDYQFANYRFENPWRELFHEIKAFLGMQAREDVSVATLSTFSFSEEAENEARKGGNRTIMPGKGTVCVAATVLHSMELFERQRHTQMAIRDAEDWLAWYYYYFTPQVQAATSLDARSAIVCNLLQLPPASASPTSPDAGQSPLPPHPLEKEYLPLLWSRACETATREEVLGYRRAMKLEAMEKATAALHARTAPSVALAPAATHDKPKKQNTDADATEDVLDKTTPHSPVTPTETDANSFTAENESSVAASVDDVLRCVEEEPAHEVLPCCPSPPPPLPFLYAEASEPATRVLSCRTSPTTARVDEYTGRIKNGFVVAHDEDMDEDENIIAVDSYQTVNVGCFGLSFFSFFD